jgi:smad nuclear-interacting protein 1
MQWTEPVDARAPSIAWRLYVFKNGEVADTLYVHRQSAYLIGRDAQVADIVVAHPSCSKQHAVIQFRYTEKKGVMAVRPYIMDLESTNGTFLNGERIESSKYIELLVSARVAMTDWGLTVCGN